QHGEQRAQLVEQKVVQPQAQIGQPLAEGSEARQSGEFSGRRRRAHRKPPTDTGARGPLAVEVFLPRCSGFTKATSVPSGNPSMATRLSVRYCIFTSRGSNCFPFFR